MADTPTADPFIVIESRRKGYVRYRRKTDGRRWEVNGECDRRGDCIVGAVLAGYTGRGPGGSLADMDDLLQARHDLGLQRVISDLDVPVTPEFNSCCGGAGLFSYTELPPGPVG